jgi:hypothetical protein
LLVVSSPSPHWGHLDELENYKESFAGSYKQTQASLFTAGIHQLSQLSREAGTFVG